MSGIKRDKFDAVFSQLVRERAGWCCERCERYFPEGDRQGLDTAHFFGRRKRATRFHPDNASSLCRGCHSVMDANPRAHTQWTVGRIGSYELDALEFLSNQVMKWSKDDMAKLYQSMKDELKDMQVKRMNGETKRLEFKGSKILNGD